MKKNMLSLLLIAALNPVYILSAASSSGVAAEVRDVLDSGQSAYGHNLVLLLDRGRDTGQSGIELSLALTAKNAVIIASTNLVVNYINTEISAARLNKEQVGESLNGFFIFKHPKAKFFILIPKEYVQQQKIQYEKATKSSDVSLDLVVGLNLSNPSNAVPVRPTLNDVYQHAIGQLYQNIGIGALQLTVPATINDVLPLFIPYPQAIGSWNIFMSGHGLFQETPEQYYDYLETKKQKLIKLRQELEQYKDPTSEVLPNLDPRFVFELNKKFASFAAFSKNGYFVPEEIDVSLFVKKYNHVPALPETVIKLVDIAIESYAREQLHGSAESEIAGITLSQFNLFLNFLKNKIPTSFFYYSSCFSGGANLDLVERALEKQRQEAAVNLKQLNPNFIIVVAGTTDALTAVSKINFGAFFDSVNEFVYPTRPSKDDPLKTLLNAIASIEPQTYSLFDDGKKRAATTYVPSVYFPSIGLFRALNIKNVKAINYALEAARELEDEPINIENKLAVLVYPAEVKVPLYIEPFFSQREKSDDDSDGDENDNHLVPNIISMIPGPATHRLKEIDAPNITLEKLFDAFVAIVYAYDKTWIIDQIVAKDKNGGGAKSISNVMIQNIPQIKGTGAKQHILYQDSQSGQYYYLETEEASITNYEEGKLYQSKVVSSDKAAALKAEFLNKVAPNKISEVRTMPQVSEQGKLKAILLQKLHAIKKASSAYSSSSSSSSPSSTDVQ